MNWTDDQMGRYTDVWMVQQVGAWMKVVGDLASVRDGNLLNSPCPLRDESFSLMAFHTPSVPLPCFNLGLSSDVHLTQ